MYGITLVTLLLALSQDGFQFEVIDTVSDLPTQIALSPRMNYLAAGTFDGNLLAYDLSSKRLSGKTKRHAVYSVAISPDGKIIAAGGLEEITLWNHLEDKEPAVIPDKSAHRMRSVQFCPKGKTLVTGDSLGRVTTWNVDTHQRMRPIAAHDGVVYSVTCSPDGKYIGSCGQDGVVKVWEFSTGNLFRQFAEHQRDVSSVTFSPDSRLIASAGVDQSVRVWDLESRERRLLLREHKGIVCSVGFSSDGKYLITASHDESIRIFDLQGAEIVRLSGHPKGTLTALITPDSRSVFSCGFDNTIRKWKLNLK